MSSPRGLRPLEVTEAYELAARIERAVTGTLDQLLARLAVCGECGHGRDRHRDDGPCGRCLSEVSIRPGQGCGVFVWAVTVGEIVSALTYMKGMTRHEQRIDADLGLDVKKIQQVTGSPIAEALARAGVTLEQVRKMTVTEKADLMLRVGRGEMVVEAEVVKEVPGDGA